MTGNTCPWMGGKPRITGGKLVLLSVVRGTYAHLRIWEVSVSTTLKRLGLRPDGPGHVVM